MTTINIIKNEFHKIESSDVLEQYYKFVNIENSIHILNPGFKTNPININSLLDFKKYININNENPEYYFNLHPLKKSGSRKNNNVDNFHLIGLDIERTDKIGKEELYDLHKVKDIIYSDIINKFELTNYMLLFSGNGYHLYIMLNNKYYDEDNNNTTLNNLYSSLITQLSKSVNKFIKITDRKDLAGILRIPMTYNTKANRQVTLEDFKNISNNDKFQQQLDIYYNNFLSIKDTENNNIIYENNNDIFFTSLLNNKQSWEEWNNILDNSIDRNANFVKNLGIFLYNNKELKKTGEDFLYQWDNKRVSHMMGWYKKAENSKFVVNYLELKKWCSDNNITKWSSLIDEQLKSSIFDDYEFYLLSDEKENMDYLIYYKSNKTYIVGSISKILSELYTSLNYKKIDIAAELDLSFSDSWEKLSYDKREKCIKTRLKTIIEKEKIIKINNTSYKPIDEHIIIEGHKKYLNTYQKSLIWDYYIKKDNYDFKHIKSILMNLCENNKEYYNYFNNWLAHIIQKPTEKMATAIVLQGKPGSGKTLFTSTILGKIFNRNIFPVNQTLLDSPYNDYIFGKQLCIGNEVVHNESKYKTPELLKILITDQDITINEKFKSPKCITSYTHWIFCSNKTIPIYIEPDDRRYNIFNSKLSYRYENLDEQQTGLEIKDFLNNKIDDEVKEYISYLKSINLDNFTGYIPINTEAKSDIININKPYSYIFIDNIREYPNFNDFIESEHLNDITETQYIINNEYIAKNTFFNLYKKWCEVNGNSYPGTKNKFSRYLKDLNIMDKIMSIKDDTTGTYKSMRVYILQTITLKEVAENE